MGEGYHAYHQPSDVSTRTVGLHNLYIYPVLGKLLLESNNLQLLITYAFNGQFTKTTRYQNVQSLWMLPVMLRPDGQNSLKAKIWPWLQAFSLGLTPVLLTRPQKMC